MPAAAPSPGDIVRGLTLQDVDWSDADLTEAVFEDCTIIGAQLSNAVLEGVRFRQCQLVGWRLSHVEAQDVVFESCVLTDAKTHKGLVVAFSRFEQARFVQCDLSFSEWDRSDLHGVQMEDCNLRGARLEKTAFSKQIGKKVIPILGAFHRCNFHLAQLSDLGLRGCDFEGSRFREADLSGSDLEEATLIDCDLFGANLSNAKLAGADLRRSEISGLDLDALASRIGMKITVDQQHMLLAALGVEVSAS